MKRLLSLGFLSSISCAAWAQSTAHTPTNTAETPAPKTVHRSQYNLFNPTPPAQMRDFAPDRPSVTNGPYTVDPGHLLLEVGSVEYARDRYNPERVRLDGFAFGDTNLRIGVTSSAEVDLSLTAYSYVRIKDKAAGGRLKQSGIGDLTLRSKINCFGDDGGPFAIGLIPFVTFPTDRGGVGQRGFSAGVGIPIQFALPAGFQLGAETTVQTVHEPGGGSHFDYLDSISLGHPITKRLSTYVELVADLSTAAHSGWIGTFDAGLVYQPVNNWQLDAGVNTGLTKAANDAFIFAGAAWRY
jgi:Putative MetA-pathway of phenol degradation